jgi:hypothetical protein
MEQWQAAAHRTAAEESAAATQGAEGGTSMTPLSSMFDRGGTCYVTARIKDLIVGALRPPASRPDVLTGEQLRSCPNYIFYCRTWRSLTEVFPEVQFVRSVGLYRGASDWLKRWPTERFEYQSLILITFPSLPYSTGQTAILGPNDPFPDKFHYVGAGVVREVADMVAMGKPVCVIETDCSAIAYRVVDRFALTPVLRPSKTCLAIVGEDPDASLYAPDCSAVEAALGLLTT